MTDIFPVEPVVIEGLGRVVKVGPRYSYDADPTKCPLCGGYGIAWAGWFSCECCPATAWIATGEVVLPAPLPGGFAGARQKNPPPGGGS